MWPFDNMSERSRNPDEQVYIPLQEKMLHRWMQQEGIAKLPSSFSDYLNFVTRTLEDNQKKGAIAEKSRSLISDRRSSATLRAKKLRRSTRSIRLGEFRPNRSIALFRITFFVIWCGRADGFISLCISTVQSESATTST
jgi:hypothetical protein